MTLKTIIFDFDGVLVDTFDFCYAINKRRDPSLTEEGYKELFNGNINDCLKTAKKTVEDPSKPKIDFFSLYTPELLKKEMRKDIQKLIRQLAERFPLYIVSSTNSEPIKQFLTQNDSLSAFTAVYGNDVEKSKVKKLSMILEKTKLAPSECVMITDTLGDIVEARKVGISCIAVSWGYHGEESLARGEPAAIVHSVDELTSVIANLR